MPRRRMLALASALMLSCVLAHSASATQVEYRSLPELGREAGLVVRGQVSSTRSYWNDAHTRILTEVTIQVDESYKGLAPSSVRIVQMGGEVDGMRMTVAGSLGWQRNEEVVLFLETSLPGRYRVSGFHQGKYEVQRDPRTRELFVQSAPLGDLKLVGGPEPTSDRMPLRTLIRQALPELQAEPKGGE